jgi:hypothetical protein
MPITHVELELAPGPKRPFGDGNHVYDLYLPILADGHIDQSRLGCCDGHCHFRCRRPGDCRLAGLIRLDSSGELALHSRETGEAGRIAMAAEQCRFRAGDLLPISEDGEAPGLFQVAWTREE